MTTSSQFVIRSKIWIEDQAGNVVFGSGRLHILDAVERHGSILAAAKELHMSYRAVWGKIKATEERLGQPLLTRKVGGARGGGSDLTPLAKTVVGRFRTLQTRIKESADELFQDVFVDGLEVDRPDSQV